MDNIIKYKLIYFVIVIIVILISYVFAKTHRKFQKFLLIFSSCYTLIYLFWRTFYTLPNVGIISIILGVILLITEIIGFFQALLFRVYFWKDYKVDHIPIEKFKSTPSVDVFIATYNEPISILKRTAIACTKIEYPKELLNIYICDDGRREEVKLLCKDIGINYITREENEHAKAGNINNAIKNSNGKFILLLDADMVPKKTILKRMLGQFVDDKVGFVQAPQVFYNPDPFQYNLYFGKSIANEQDFFMREIQGGRARFNAVLHVGTNAIFRRKTLEDIGGIPTGSITEDMATGMLIQAKGYKTVFINEVLAIGLSSESFGDLIKQRDRWCRGNIQVVKKWNPLTVKGLKPIQRIIYIDGFIYWFFGVFKMIYIFAPLIYLLTGTIILRATAMDLLIFFTPSFLASILFFRSAVPNTRTLTWSHIYETAMTPYIALSAIFELIFSKPLKFNVTPKGVINDKSHFSFKLALPHVLVLILTIIAWIKCSFLGYFTDFNLINSVFINIAWSIYNFFGIFIAILLCIERPRQRSAERFDLSLNLNVSTEDLSHEEVYCTLQDISETGSRVICNRSIPLDQMESGDSIKISSDKIGEVFGQVAWARGNNKDIELGIKFKELDIDQYSEVIEAMFEEENSYINSYSYKFNKGPLAIIKAAISKGIRRD